MFQNEDIENETPYEENTSLEEKLKKDHHLYVPPILKDVLVTPKRMPPTQNSNNVLDELEVNIENEIDSDVETRKAKTPSPLSYGSTESTSASSS